MSYGAFVVTATSYRLSGDVGARGRAVMWAERGVWQTVRHCPFNSGRRSFLYRAAFAGPQVPLRRPSSSVQSFSLRFVCLCDVTCHVFPVNVEVHSLFQKIQRHHNLFEWPIASFLGPDFSASPLAFVCPAELPQSGLDCKLVGTFVIPDRRPSGRGDLQAPGGEEKSAL